MATPSPAASRVPKLASLVAVTLACAAALWLLRSPLGQFDTAVWGPEQPWVHRDFLGAWWLFWAAGEPEGIGAWLAQQNWPDGGLGLRQHIPNPFDAWLLGPWVDPTEGAAWWNRMQLAHHLANVGTATLLARALGGRLLAAAAAGALVAASPVMLHEIAGGRTLSGAVWPGLLALVFLIRDRPVIAGLLVGVQGLCYVYSGLLVGLAALLLRPHPGLFSALLIMGPYLAWLGPAGDALSGRAPPAGYTSMPLAGLLGQASLPPPMRWWPLLWLCLGGLFVRTPRSRLRSRTVSRAWRPSSVRLGLALLLLVGVALGPSLSWQRTDPGVASPLAWAMWAMPPLSRMHHPVRALLLAIPLLAAVGARARLPRVVWLGVFALCLTRAAPMNLAATAEASPTPPGAEAALWLADAPDVGAIVDLGASLAEPLALQTLHRRPVLTGFRAAGSRRDDTSRALAQALQAWRDGDPSPSLPSQLRSAGYSHAVEIIRPGGNLPDPSALFGPPVYQTEGAVIYGIP